MEDREPQIWGLIPLAPKLCVGTVILFPAMEVRVPSLAHSMVFHLQSPNFDFWLLMTVRTRKRPCSLKNRGGICRVSTYSACKRFAT
jgi:hypothetical protein